MNEQQFKNQIDIKYNNKYNLSNIWYRTKEYPISVTCPLHETFQIKPSIFLNNHGCPICNDKPIKIIKLKEDVYDYTHHLQQNEAFLYCVKLTNKETNESFYKIGVTTQNIYKRLSTKHFKVEPLLMYKDHIDTIYTMEETLHFMLKTYSYKPAYIPNGITECYSIDSPIPYIVFNLVYV